ncbi:MAG: glycosyltransferase family 4 protein [Alphaproteobacteria bacterium]
MRILILQDYLRCGGTERQSVHLSRFFHAEGNEVGLLAFRPGGALTGEVPDDVAHRTLQARDTGLNWLAPGLFGAIRELAPDVVLCMGRMANSYAGFIQLRFPDLAVVGTVRTGKALPALNLWSFRLVSGVLTNTTRWRDALIARGLDPAKIAVVPNGLTHAWNGKRRTTVRTKMRRRLAVTPATVVYLNVANFRRGKRQAHLIELFSSLDASGDWQLWLVGDGQQWRRCHRRADRLIDSGRVRFIGHLADPFPCYAAADVAVSTSIEDALPNFLVEAQTLGLPVVATDYGGADEGMRDRGTGFLVGAGDRDEFLEAIRELYRHPDLRRRLGQQARRFAAENHASERQASRFLEVLRAFYAQAQPPFEQSA